MFEEQFDIRAGTAEKQKYQVSNSLHGDLLDFIFNLQKLVNGACQNDVTLE